MLTAASAAVIGTLALAILATALASIKMMGRLKGRTRITVKLLSLGFTVEHESHSAHCVSDSPRLIKTAQLGPNVEQSVAVSSKKTIAIPPSSARIISVKKGKPP